MVPTKLKRILLMVAVGWGALASGASALDMEFVVVGDPCNPDDTAPAFYTQTMYFGGVNYVYKIGKYEVTNAQYTEFLNAVAATDSHGLYNASMADSTYSNRGGITRSGSSGSYTYAAISGRENKPVNWVNWFDVARFCNWMHNGQESDPGTIEYGAYDFSNPLAQPATHDPNARYWIPRVDEWYKAAFYKGEDPNAGYWSYPTQSDSAPGAGPVNTTNHANYCANNYDWGEGLDHGDTSPVGFYSASPGPYGTFDQCSNLYEWCENWMPGWVGQRRMLYGSYFLESCGYTPSLSQYEPSGQEPAVEGNWGGFRIAGSASPANCAEVHAYGWALAADVKPDCYITLGDFAILAGTWLHCYDPSDPDNCEAAWVQNY